MRFRISLELEFRFRIRLSRKPRPERTPHADRTPTADRVPPAAPAEQPIAPAQAPAPPETAAAEAPEPTVGQVVEAEVERARIQLSRSTAENFATAGRSLMAFLGGDRPMVQLTPDAMQQYGRWLRQRGVSLNTSSCYMRTLRAMLNHAAAAAGQQPPRLFGNVYTGHARTEKRSAGQDAMARLAELQLPRGSFDSLARDVFLFCFYAMGMPFVDAAHLRHDQLEGNRFHYDRHKTGQRISVAIEPPMSIILGRYARRADSPYVFPLLTPGQEHRYPNLLGRYNRALRRIAEKARLQRPLTSYVARHTWASAAYAQNVDLHVISRALGHTNPNTTLTYIREIDDTRLQQANRCVIGHMAMSR